MLETSITMLREEFSSSILQEQWDDFLYILEGRSFKSLPQATCVAIFNGTEPSIITALINHHNREQAFEILSRLIHKGYVKMPEIDMCIAMMCGDEDLPDDEEAKAALREVIREHMAECVLQSQDPYALYFKGEDAAEDDKKLFAEVWCKVRSNIPEKYRYHIFIKYVKFLQYSNDGYDHMERNIASCVLQKNGEGPVAAIVTGWLKSGEIRPVAALGDMIGGMRSYIENNARHLSLKQKEGITDVEYDLFKEKYKIETFLNADDPLPRKLNDKFKEYPYWRKINYNTDIIAPTKDLEAEVDDSVTVNALSDSVRRRGKDEKENNKNLVLLLHRASEAVRNDFLAWCIKEDSTAIYSIIVFYIIIRDLQPGLLSSEATVKRVKKYIANAGFLCISQLDMEVLVQNKIVFEYLLYQDQEQSSEVMYYRFKALLNKTSLLQIMALAKHCKKEGKLDKSDEGDEQLNILEYTAKKGDILLMLILMEAGAKGDTKRYYTRTDAVFYKASWQYKLSSSCKDDFEERYGIGKFNGKEANTEKEIPLLNLVAKYLLKVEEPVDVSLVDVPWFIDNMISTIIGVLFVANICICYFNVLHSYNDIHERLSGTALYTIERMRMLFPVVLCGAATTAALIFSCNIASDYLEASQKNKGRC